MLCGPRWPWSCRNRFCFRNPSASNILRGRNNLSANDLDQIIKASRCASLIERLPDGVDSVLAESGNSISSGERQLLSIARAFARDPQLLILDEATSYIDSQTEAGNSIGVDLFDGATHSLGRCAPSFNGATGGPYYGRQPGPDHRKWIALRIDGTGRVLFPAESG